MLEMSQLDIMPSVSGQLSMTNKKITPSNKKMDPEMQGTQPEAVFLCFCVEFLLTQGTQRASKLNPVRALEAVQTAHLGAWEESSSSIALTLLCLFKLHIFRTTF